jgi:hypothetical protein
VALIVSPIRIMPSTVSPFFTDSELKVPFVSWTVPPLAIVIPSSVPLPVWVIVVPAATVASAKIPLPRTKELPFWTNKSRVIVSVPPERVKGSSIVRLLTECEPEE